MKNYQIFKTTLSENGGLKFENYQYLKKISFSKSLIPNLPSSLTFYRNVTCRRLGKQNLNLYRFLLRGKIFCRRKKIKIGTAKRMDTYTYSEISLCGDVTSGSGILLLVY